MPWSPLTPYVTERLMKVLLLSKYDKTAASSRLRCLQYISYLEAFGLSVVVSSLLDETYLKTVFSGQSKPVVGLMRAYFKRFMVLFKSKQFDLLWIHMELFPQCPGVFERMLKQAGVRYVVDFDDAIFHDYDQSASDWVRFFLKNKIKNMWLFYTIFQEQALLSCSGKDALGMRNPTNEITTL